MGYTSAAFEKQRDLEQRLRAGVAADEIGAFHKMVTRQPHMAGTDAGREVAEYVRNSLAAAGLDAEVLEYDAYLSFPKSIAVDIVAPRAERLRVTEPPSPLDRDTQNPALGPGFVAYAASGDVDAPVVYVNYGLPDDYAQLALRDVDVRGKLVIARYGRSHRAVKLHTAEQAGAAGILIYSDPADDGFVRGEPWPKGYWRTPDQIQRGNGKYSWFWYGAYHSNYDTRYFVDHVAGPKFQGGAQLARLLGTTALRLGESQILPFRFSHYATRLKEFVDTASTWSAGEDRGAGAPGVNNDGRALAPDLTPLRDAVARVAAQANLVERRVDDRLAPGDVPASTQPRLNDAIARLEQRLLDDHLQWYRHVIYGWNIYSLYDGQPFPLLAEAIRVRDAERARVEVARIADAINRLNEGLREISGLLDQR